ncbi:MAG: hypothetical protein JXA21_20370 [Anaerolineae bacterium]|nr:hypothetical protein [Anaerolineae bacterium]
MHPNVTMTITWILVLARLIIAVQLTRVGRRQKLPNLFWLAAFFYITGIGDIGVTLSPMFPGLLRPFIVSAGLGEVMLAMFVQMTFYKDRKSPYPIFIFLALVVLAFDAFEAQFLPYHSPFNWLWIIWAGAQAYKRIAKNQTVEDWVKVRYKLVIAYALISLAGPLWTIMALVGRFFAPSFGTWLFESTPLLVAQVGILICATIGIAMQYLAWIMPEKYRKWLNRNYQSPIQEEPESGLTEEEIMQGLQA